jgi:hypothetical protein
VIRRVQLPVESFVTALLFSPHAATSGFGMGLLGTFVTIPKTVDWPLGHEKLLILGNENAEPVSLTRGTSFGTFGGVI